MFTLQGNLLAASIIVWAVVAASALGLLRVSMAKAKRAAAQIEQVREAKINLTRADSNATSGFLRGGLQSDDALNQFSSDMQHANTLLAAIRQGPGGTNAEAALKQIGPYLTEVAAARANNRQGFPVGATYQLTASTLMREQILTSLSKVDIEARNELARSGRSLNSIRNIPLLFLLLVGVPTMLALYGLSKRTNRMLNLPIVAGFALALIATTIATALSTSASTTAIANIKGAFRNRDLAGQARVALYDAKSYEALTLIKRGSGQAYEFQWKTAMATVRPALGQVCCNLDSELQAYEAAHKQVRSLDDEGNWDGAVELSVPATRLSPVSSAATFDVLVEHLHSIDSQEAAVESSSKFNGRPMGLAQTLLGIAALAAAALVRIGFRQRVKEYR